MSKCLDHGKTGGNRGYAVKTLSNPRRTIGLHRWVYSQHNNVTVDSMDGLDVRHSCDNTRCINPEHLMLGTRQDNMDDMVERNRQSQGEQHGRAKLSVDAVRHIRNVYVKGCRDTGARPLGRLYNVTPDVIRDVFNNVTWRSI